MSSHLRSFWHYSLHFPNLAKLHVVIGRTRKHVLPALLITSLAVGLKAISVVATVVKRQMDLSLV